MSSTRTQQWATVLLLVEQAAAVVVQRKNALPRYNQTDACSRFCGMTNVASTHWCWAIPSPDVCARSYLWMQNDPTNMAKPCSWYDDRCITRPEDWVSSCGDLARYCDASSHDSRDVLYSDTSSNGSHVLQNAPTFESAAVPPVEAPSMAATAAPPPPAAQTAHSSLPPLCVTYFLGECGLSKLPRTIAEVQTSFGTCCQEGGHTADLCEALSDEIFEAHGPVPATTKLCQIFLDVQASSTHHVRLDKALAGGDPQLENIRGELFELETEGLVELLRVPRSSASQAADFRVDTRIEKVKNAAYMTSLVLDGAWLQNKVNISLNDTDFVVYIDSVAQPKDANIVLAQIPLGQIVLSRTSDMQLTITVAGARIDIYEDSPPMNFYLNMEASSLRALQAEIGGALGSDGPLAPTNAANYLVRDKPRGVRAADCGSFASASLGVMGPTKARELRIETLARMKDRAQTKNHSAPALGPQDQKSAPHRAHEAEPHRAQPLEQADAATSQQQPSQ